MITATKKAANSPFSNIEKIKFEGEKSNNMLSYKYYNPDRIVLGKRMEEHLRMAVCYWHSFCYSGLDPFGEQTIERSWMNSNSLESAEEKAAAAFDFMVKLGLPYYTFHDRDVAPDGATPKETHHNFRHMVDVLQAYQEKTGLKLLWGTAALAAHKRYMAGAATNPNPEMFGMAALQVRDAMNATKQLGGENYVLWGGREGYDTILNTNIKKELDQLGRFMNMVVEHKHKIGLNATILIEPKPCEPTKHQYDFDTSTVYGFLKRYGLENEIKVNIEANHATLAGHNFEHEVATAIALDIFGSIDLNRGDTLLGWDTDQFPNNVQELAVVMYQIVQGGGFTTGGFNFDARIRRQSTDPIDLFYGHIGGIEVCARALLAAEKMIIDKRLAEFSEQRYNGWTEDFAQKIMNGNMSMDALAERMLLNNVDPKTVSGRQEYLENLVNLFV
jgi:xylose isomerase